MTPLVVIMLLGMVLLSILTYSLLMILEKLMQQIMLLITMNLDPAHQDSPYQQNQARTKKSWMRIITDLLLHSGVGSMGLILQNQTPSQTR